MLWRAHREAQRVRQLVRGGSAVKWQNWDRKPTLLILNTALGTAPGPSWGWSRLMSVLTLSEFLPILKNVLCYFHSFI